MSRCGCSETCQCLLLVEDTDCIDLTIVGLGTPTNPYTISALPIISPVTGNTLTCTPSGLFASGGDSCSSPFLFVAASDTTDSIKSCADFVCDGVADQAEINAALTAASGPMYSPAAVVLSGGTFNLSDTIVVPVNIRMFGAGTFVTFLQFDSLGDAIAGSFAMTMGSESEVSEFNLIVENNSGAGFRGGIQMLGADGKIEKIRVEILGNPGTQLVQNAAIKMGGARGAVKDCVIEAFSSQGFDTISDGDDYLIERNYIFCPTAIVIDGTYRTRVINNVIDGGGTFLGAVSSAGYNIATVRGVGISLLASTDESQVKDNTIFRTPRHGITLDSGDKNQILANYIDGRCGTETVDTYSGIFLNTTVTDSQIQLNAVHRSNTGILSLRYGIRVEAASDTDNLITNNDLLDSGITSSFSDLGTATITSAGNRL